MFLDIDGTLTDGKIYIGNQGEVIKSFNVKDGYAIAHILPLYDIVPIVITGRTSEIVSYRCAELGIRHVFQGVSNKLDKMKEILCDLCDTMSCEKGMKNVFYFGDDIPDKECMMISEKCGCPNDAANEVKMVCDYISPYNGGDGAARDFIEWLVASL